MLGAPLAPAVRTKLDSQDPRVQHSAVSTEMSTPIRDDDNNIHGRCMLIHASIKIVFEIGDPAGTSTVALFLQNKSIINSNSLRGNIHTEKNRNRKRLDGTC